jgi:hypothetical protein
VPVEGELLTQVTTRNNVFIAVTSARVLHLEVEIEIPHYRMKVVPIVVINTHSQGRLGVLEDEQYDVARLL